MTLRELLVYISEHPEIKMDKDIWIQLKPGDQVSFRLLYSIEVDEDGDTRLVGL